MDETVEVLFHFLTALITVSLYITHEQVIIISIRFYTAPMVHLQVLLLFFSRAIKHSYNTLDG